MKVIKVYGNTPQEVGEYLMDLIHEYDPKIKEFYSFNLGFWFVCWSLVNNKFFKIFRAP